MAFDKIILKLHKTFIKDRKYENKYLYAILINLIFTNILVALDVNLKITQYIYNNWQLNEGLPQNSIYSIVQTKDGYLWLATQEGLAYFDGNTFKVFNKRNSKFPHNWISSLAVDNDGNLWIGSFGGGLYQYSDKKFTFYSKENGLTNNMVTALLIINNDVWIGTNQGLYVCKDGKISPFKKNDILKGTTIRALARDIDNHLYIGTRQLGMFKYDINDDELLEYNTENGLPSNDVFSIYADDADNALWVGTYGGGLVKLKNDAMIKYNTDNGLSDNKVFSIVKDKDGNLWIGTYGGGINKLYEDKIDHYSEPAELAKDFSISIYEDKEGTIWIGSDGHGLSSLQEGKFPHFKKSEGLFSDWVMTLYEDQNGVLYIGIEDEGINCIKKDGSLTYLNEKTGLSSNLVTCISKDRFNNLWIGSDGFGLTKINENKYTYYTTKNGLSNDVISCILEDKDGSLWIGTKGGGLHKFEKDNFEVFNKENGLIGNDILCLSRSLKGTIWIGTQGNGISHLVNGKFINYTLQNGFTSDIVSCIHEDDNNVLWIGTHGQGLNVFYKGKFYQIKEEDGLFNDAVFTILEDKYSNLWMSCNKGIFCVKKNDVIDFIESKIQSIPCKDYGLKDGLFSQECNGIGNPGAGIISKSGLLYFPTSKGIVKIDPDNIPQNTIKPDVIIEKAISNNKEVDLTNDIILNYNNNDITFYYTALSFKNSKRVFFKFRLDGYDKDWVDAGNIRFTKYTNLDSGTYIFNVIACNNDGYWNEEGAKIEFKVLPPFWKTFWFYSISIILCFGIIYLFFWLRLLRLKRKHKELEKLVDIRTQELQTEKNKSDNLLLNILPKDIAEELKENNQVFPKSYDLVTVLFTDFVGFTKIAESFTPNQLIDELDKCFEYFDQVVERNNMEKIKTVGDGYLCAGGLPKSNVTNPIDSILVALEITKFMKQVKDIKMQLGLSCWELRIGIHTGPVMAGVIGKSKFAYDIWGDTVNTASRMESSGTPERINISGTTYQYIKDFFICEYRGKVPAKNKGEIEMYYVNMIKPELSVNGEGLIPNDEFKKMYESFR